jgi:hypothetical protein
VAFASVADGPSQYKYRSSRNPKISPRCGI